ncbi:MAG: amino acid adenylation domain-containing protein, partial [Candidatus Aminicenantes bacterium]|nr:amino acid adenylation domain-containing protein [Candidatus Aminicenantes bacterium]
NSLRAFEEQEYQYEALVEKIEKARDSSRNPLFDVMFVLQNMDMPELEMPGLKIKRNLQEDRASKFDMTLYCEEKGDSLVFKLEYCTKLFKPGTIARYITYFKNILSALVTDPAQKIGAIEFITGKEKREILYDFNDTEVAYPRKKTICRLFEDQVAKTPEKTALLQSSELYRRSSREEAGSGGRGLTYRQLNERTNRLARVLRAKGVKANSIVGIMLERSIELIEGLYAVLKAGGAYLPIDPEYPESRILSMLENSRALMLLTGKEVVRRKNLPAIPQEIVHIDEISGIITGQPGENIQPLSQPKDLIYVIFTSGSTGIPKGAGVYQRSFVNLMNWFVTDFALNETDSNLLMTSFSFDLTQKNLYASLILGGTLNLPAINYFDPGEILREIEENNVTWINCTPSMFFQLIEFCKEDELKKLETLRYVYLGGEPISIAMFLKWLDSDYCHGEIVNTYGPTECTDISNSFRVREPHRYLREPVPIGAPIFNVELVVADRNLQLLPVGFAGELLIAGDSVGIGYINDRELTERKFVRCSFEEGKPARIYYRTGDLVKWLPGGATEFIGRMDYQVKIRGFRIEIGEIESRLLDHEEIKEAVVTDRNDESGGKYLCAYFVPTGSLPPTATELRENLSRTLPDYMIPSYFVQLREMPLNPNGKVNRKALPVPEILSEKEYTAPRSDLEDSLAKIWAEVLGIEKGRIGIDDNFFELGGHSLKAAELTARIHQQLNVEIALREIFRIFTIKSLAEYIGRERKSHYVTIALVEEKEYYSLSSAQERLYLLQQMNMESTVYNIPFVALLEGDLDKEKLQETFLQLIERHESLRTTFHMLTKEPVQKIHKPEDIEFKIEYFSGVGAGLPQQSIRDSSNTIAHLVGHFVRPFDLSGALLLRVGLIALEEKKHILMMDMHHIITDGTSMDMLKLEFMTLFAGKILPLPVKQYRDFAKWQNAKKESESISEQKKYWLDEFAGEIPVLDLPTDFLRPPIRDFSGDTLAFHLDTPVTKALNALTGKEGVTLYMTLTALFNILLARLSGQEDIIIGTPAAGRIHYDLKPLVGMFVNTLALRNYPRGEKMFREFLQEVKSSIVEAQENQEFQFEDLVEAIDINRDAGHNPLFDVMFVMQDPDTARIEIPGLMLSPYKFTTKSAKFDMTLVCEKAVDGLFLTVEYATSLFSARTIKRFVTYFKKIMTGVLGDTSIRIRDIDMLSPQEKRQLLVNFNQVASGYPVDETICRLFANQVERTPLNPAINAAGKELSFRELDEKSGMLAFFLINHGIKPDEPVALMVEPSPEMIIAIIGILKTGSAYIPLNPQALVKRTAYILNDCNIRILLTTRMLFRTNEAFQNLQVDTIFIDEAGSRVGSRRAVPVESPGGMAYIIFTSGSTGKPKGVPISHVNLSPLLQWGCRELEIGPDDRTIQNLSYYFDWSVWEIFITLTTGACLYPVPADVLLNPDACTDFIIEKEITILNITPSQYRYLVDREKRLHTLKYLFIGAEKLDYDLTERSLTSVKENCRIFNMYGPTEATIIAAVLEIDKKRYLDFKTLSSIPIGKPIGNTRLFILDRYSNLSPVGVTGELCISGDGIAHGYLNRPELTVEKFGANPYAGGESAARRGLERIYRTGDLCRWLPDGNIEFSGRIDQQVKIRGHRIELGEIENRLLEHELVKEVVVLHKENDAGEKYLCAYIVEAENIVSQSGGLSVEAQGVVLSDLRQFLSRLLPDYMVPAHFVLLEKIPLNPNGKVNRKALPVPEILSEKEYTAPRSDLEDSLVKIWAEILGIEKGRIGIDANFFEMGGHSLKATLLVFKIQEKLSRRVPLTEIFKTPTIRELAGYIRAAQVDEYTAIEPAKKKNHYPLSAAQKRLFILNQMEKDTIGYNMPIVVLLKGKPERDRFTETFRKLIVRHESLRTSFHRLDEEFVQRVHDPEDVEFEIEYHESVGARRAVPGEFPSTGGVAAGRGGLDSETRSTQFITDIIDRFIRPFDLSVAPLLRAGLIPLEKQEHILMVDTHHIISDGTSLGIITGDFMTLYSGKELTPLRIHYKDYCEWQNCDEQKKSLQQQGTYWQERFAGEIPVLDLPTDYPRPAVQSSAGRTVFFEIGPEETASLNRIALEKGATLYMVLLAVYNILLTKLSGREDIIVGAPTAGRRHVDLQGIIGMFINTLSMRNFPAGDKTFRNFLQEVKTATLEAFENQDYQFEDLVEKVQVSRDVSRNPLFDVMFALQNMEVGNVEIPGLKLSSYEYENRTAKFDMTLQVFEVGK